MTQVGSITALALALLHCSAPAQQQPPPDEPSPPVETRQPIEPVDTPPPVETVSLVDGECPATDLERFSGQPLIVPAGETVILGRGPYHFAFICLESEASLRICDTTKIVVDGLKRTVIGARGIGPIAGQPAEVIFESEGGADFFVLFDNKRAKMRAELYLQRSAVTTALTGKTGLFLDGEGAHTMNSNLGWGDTHNFPTGCP